MIYCGDSLTVLKGMADESVDMCVTSPPYYGLRDYGEDGQIGLEDTPDQFISALADVFDEVKRVLKDDGTLWVNIGDSYAGRGKGAWENKERQKEVYVPDSNSPQVKMRKTWDGIKQKDLIGIPWMLAFELRRRGWYLRQDIIWHKPNPMPESVKDRCTKSHEYIFLLSKSPKYYFDHEAIQEIATGYDGRKDTLLKGSHKYENETHLPSGVNTQSMAKRGHERWKFKNLAEKGKTPNTMHLRRAVGEADFVYPMRNKRDVWSVSTKPYSGAHFAVFPEKLIEPCIMAGSKYGGIVLDPFSGAGTTGVVCKRLGREYIGIELNREYVALSEKRIKDAPEFQEQLSLF